MQAPAFSRAPQSTSLKASRPRGIAIALLSALALWTFACQLPSVYADAADDFAVALKLYKSKRFDVAADSFGDFISRHPNDPQRSVAELYLGQSLMQIRKFKEARETFSSFLAANAEHPDRALAMYRLGECSFFLNEPKAAQTAFDDFLSKHADNELAPWAWQYLGESRLQLADPAGALKAFQTVGEKFPKSSLVPESKFGIARANEALKDLDAAVAAYTELSADVANPRAADALFHIGTLQYDAGHYAEAAKAFSAVRERFPDSSQAARADLNAGYSLFYLGDYDKAAEAFEQAAKSPEDEATARLWIGLSRKSQNRYADAVAVLQPAYEKLGNSGQAEKLLFHWADSTFRAGDGAAAAPLFLQLVEKFPKGEMADRALHLAVESSLQARNLEQAEKLHQRFVAEYPNSRLGMLESLLYGRVLLAKAETPRGTPLTAEAEATVRAAADQFTRVLNESRVEGTRDWGRLLLGRAQQQLEDDQAALATLKPLTERLLQSETRGEFTEALLLAGNSAIQTSDWATAEADLTKYLDLAPTSTDAPSALSRLSIAKVQQGEIADLAAMWERYRSLGIADKTIADAIHAAAELSFEQQKWADAETLFIQLNAMKGVPGYAAIALSGMGHSAYQLKNYPAAAEAFSSLITNAAGDDAKLTADAVFMRGLALELAGQTKEAADAFRTGALSLTGGGEKLGTIPEDPDVAWGVYRSLLGAARAFAKVKDVASADASYEDAWTVLQKLSDERKAEIDKLLNEWAVVNYDAGQFARSDELFQRLVDSYSQSEFHDDARLHLAESLIQSEKFDEAETAFKQLLDDAASDEFVREATLVNLMELAARKQDWKSSGQYADDLLQQFPDSSKTLEAKYRKGEAALRMDDFETAQQMLSQVREALIAPTAENGFEWSEGAWLLLTEAELQLRNYPEVDRLAEEFATRFPMSKVTYQLDYILGRRFSRAAEFEKAREAFQRVVDSSEGARTLTAAQAQFEIAEAFLKQKDHTSAIREYYKVALGYDVPDIQSAAYFQAGQCEEVLDKADSAIKTYEELIQKFPESTFAAKAGERVAALKPLTQ